MYLFTLIVLFLFVLFFHRLICNLDDDINPPQFIFNEQMEPVTIHENPTNDGFYLFGFLKNKKIYPMHQCQYPDFTSFKDYFNGLDSFRLGLKHIESKYNIPCFDIKIQMTYDASSYDTKGNTTTNTYGVAMSNLISNNPIFDISVNKSKDIEIQTAIIESIFPHSNDPILNRKVCRLTRHFISDTAIHPSGAKWCDIIKQRSQFPVSQLSPFEQALFPQGIPYCEWKFNEFTKGIITDAIHFYSLTQFIVDQAERFKLYDSLPVKGIVNDQYSFDREFENYDASNSICRWDRVLNAVVISFFIYLFVFFSI